MSRTIIEYWIRLQHAGLNSVASRHNSSDDVSSCRGWEFETIRALPRSSRTCNVTARNVQNTREAYRLDARCIECEAGRLTNVSMETRRTVAVILFTCSSLVEYRNDRPIQHRRFTRASVGPEMTHESSQSVRRAGGKLGDGGCTWRLDGTRWSTRDGTTRRWKIVFRLVGWSNGESEHGAASMQWRPVVYMTIYRVMESGRCRPYSNRCTNAARMNVSSRPADQHSASALFRRRCHLDHRRRRQFVAEPPIGERVAVVHHGWPGRAIRRRVRHQATVSRINWFPVETSVPRTVLIYIPSFILLLRSATPTRTPTQSDRSDRHRCRLAECKMKSPVDARSLGMRWPLRPMESGTWSWPPSCGTEWYRVVGRSVSRWVVGEWSMHHKSWQRSHVLFGRSVEGVNGRRPMQTRNTDIRSRVGVNIYYALVAMHPVRKQITASSHWRKMPICWLENFAV